MGKIYTYKIVRNFSYVYRVGKRVLEGGFLEKILES